MAELRRIDTLDEKLRASCVKAAEDLLAKAQSGEIIGFVALMDHPGNDWSYIQTECHDRIALIGKLYLAATRIAHNLFTAD